VSESELFPVLVSDVVVVTDPVLSMDEPVNAESTSTVNVVDAVALLPAIVPMTHVTVPDDSEHSVGSELTVRSDESTSVTMVPCASDGPLLVTFSVMVVVLPATAGFGENVLSILTSDS